MIKKGDLLCGASEEAAEICKAFGLAESEGVISLEFRLHATEIATVRTQRCVMSGVMPWATVFDDYVLVKRDVWEKMNGEQP